MSNVTPEELTDEAMKPGKFNIIAALKERAHPSDEVVIYLDEETAYAASKIQDEIDVLEKLEVDGGFILKVEKADELIELKDKREKFIEKLNESKCIITITGISEGKREELLEAATEKFPHEYDEDKNPFTGEVTRKEKDNPKLNRYFTNLLWEAHITKIVDANGDIQDAFSYDEIVEFRNLLPVSAVSSITESVEKLRVATAMFMIKVDEDFLAKS